MATYEELFPNGDPELQRPFKPIQPRALGGQLGSMVKQRSALGGEGIGGAMDAPSDGIDLSDITGLLKKPASSETEWKDFGRAALAGVGGLGTAATGAVEYAADRLAGEGNTPLEQAATDLRNTATSARIQTQNFSQDQVAAMTPEAQARLSREWLTLDPNRTIWQGGADEFVSSLALKVSQAAPSTLATLLPGALLLRAGMGSGAVAYLGASEGALSLGSIAANIATEIEQAPEEELAQSQRYQQLSAELGPEGARQQLIREAQGYAPVIGGLVVGAIGAAAGRYLEPVFVDKAAGAASRFARGFGSEAIQESSQSGTEQVAQNVAAQVFDTGRSTFEGVPEAMAEGAAVGGLSGGLLTAAMGRRREAPGAAPAATEPAVEPAKPGLPEDIQAALWASLEPASPDDTPPLPVNAGFDPYTGQGQLFPPGGQESVPGELAPQEAPGMTPRQEQEAYVRRPWPIQQGELDFADRPVARSEEPLQGELDLRVRERGVGRRQDQPGQLPPPDTGPDLTQPTRAPVVDEGQIDLFDQTVPEGDFGDVTPEPRQVVQSTPAGPRRAVGYALRVLDSQGNLTGEDLFQTAEEANAAADQIAQTNPEAMVRVERAYERAPAVAQNVTVQDEPSAEPLSDLSAQLSDMKAGKREAVYLSRMNLDSLRQRGLTERVRGAGVPLTNFDGKGGTLIAKDRQTAEVLLDMREQGMDMQEILGTATGAGTGKPVGNIVVQQRDNAGNVTRETLVATPEEADALAAQYETDGRTSVVLSANAAIRRRNQRIAAEDVTVSKKLKARAERRARAEAAEKAPKEPPRLSPEREREPELPPIEMMSEEQVDALKDSEIDDEFIKAVSYMTGARQTRARDQQSAAPDKVNTGDLDQGFEISEGDPTSFDKIVKRLRTPSERRKYVRRVQRYIRSRQFGKGKVRPITRTASEVRPEGKPARAERRGEFDPTSLLNAEPPKGELEMSEAKRAELRMNLTAARTKLRESLGAFMKLRRQMLRQTYDGLSVPDRAYAKAYAASLYRFGRALYAANPRSGKGLQQMELFNKLVASLTAGSPQANVKALSKAMRAEARENVAGAASIDPKRLKVLKDPEKRLLITLKTNQKIATAAAIRKAAGENSFFKSALDPFMRKLVAYVMSDGEFPGGNMQYGLRFKSASEVGPPSPAEYKAVQFALRMLRKNPQTRDTLYKPVQKWMQQFGFEFKDGDFVIPKELPDTVLLDRRYNRRFGERDTDIILGSGIATTRSPDGSEDVAPVAESASAAARFAAREQKIRDAVAQNPMLTEEQARAQVLAQERTWVDNDFVTERGAEKIALTGAINKAIRELRTRLKNERISDLDLLDAEQRMLDFLQQAGALKPTSIPNRYALSLPNGTVRTFRSVSAAFRKNEISRADAREQMLNLYREVPLSEASTRSEDLKQRAAKNFKEVAKRRTESMKKAERARELAMTPEQRRLKEAYARRDEASKGLKLIDDGGTPSDYKLAGERLGALLSMKGGVTANEALDALAGALPPGTMVAKLVARLRALNMDAVVLWADTLDGNARGTVSWDRTGMTIRLNQSTFRKENMQDPGNAGGRLAHALLHEAVHAATANALRRDPSARAVAERLLSLARVGLKGQKFYGLQDADEFVAEAFTNPDFQQALRGVKLRRVSSMWDAFVDFVKRVIGWQDLSGVDNALDAVLMLTDNLFTGQTPEVSGDKLAMFDTVAPKIADVLDRQKQARETVNAVRDRAAEAGESASNFLLSAMTMEQIRDFYGKYFRTDSQSRSTVDRNPLAAYWNAYTERNADNSQSMERADQLSRKWTELVEKHGQEAIAELSQVMTDATVFEVHPDVPLTDKANEHVTTAARKAKHAQLAQRLSKLAPDVREHYSAVRKYYLDTLKREVELMTLNALRGYVASGPQAKMTRDQFIAKYTEDTVGKLGLNTKKGLRAEFPEDVLSDEAVATISKIANIPGMFKGPYFPLKRFGKYAVYAKRVRNVETFSTKEDMRAYVAEQEAADPTLDIGRKMVDGQWQVTVSEVDFRLAETRSAAEAHRKDMVSQYGGKNVTPVQLKESFYAKDATIATDTQLDTLLKRLEGNNAAQAAIKDFYLRSLSDRSFRKHEAYRQNTRGYETDTQHRTFAAYSKASAYYTAQLRHGWRMAEAKSKMREWVRSRRDESTISTVKLQQVLGEIIKRDEMTTDPTELSNFVRKGTELSHFMLLTSPSYWLINATQPYLVTLPWLAARVGMGNAAAAMKNAQQLIASPLLTQSAESWGGIKALTSKVAAEKAFTVLEQVEAHIKARAGDRADDYIDMLQRLKRQSIIDMSFIAELRDVAEGVDKSLTGKVLDASRIMAHLTEVNNRIVTALAAYDVSRAQGRPHSDATDFAKRAVSLTQFNYSSGNKPRLFQQKGPLGFAGPLAFQFMQYPQHMYALMVGEFLKAVKGGTLEREVAIKTLGGIFATHLAAGGLLGAAIQPLKWAIGMAIAGLNDDDDEAKDVLSGETFDRAIREGAAEMFGTELGLLLSKGLPAAAGTDLSSRMSLGTLYFIDLKTDNAESLLGSLMMTFGGPLPGLATGAWRGMGMINEGEYVKGLEYFAPKALKDVMRFYRYGDEGVTTATGATIINPKEVSPLALFYQSLGFQPTQVSEAYERSAAIKSRQRTEADRRESLMRQFTNADTPEQRAAVREEIREFNRRAPANPITYSSLAKSVQRARSRDTNLSRYGADLRGRQVRYAEEGDPYLTE